ncbi:hypothetical protein [Legionella erythra]|uniref:Uncharacterized protein n=1 Tax=Legionella erythra TaxID=448 RepID=A0A0W0TVZ5_LEGER|nr:hypothetical protein [Legionella erythra]KTC99858.1 hypothetical protein Lery_0212 [Legionella erythra]
MTLSVDEIKKRMDAMMFTLGYGETVTLSFSFATQLRFDVHFLQRVKTTRGYGTVIGELIEDDLKPLLFVWWDESAYPSPLPANTPLKKIAVNSLYSFHPASVFNYMGNHFSKTAIKTLIAAGNYPLGKKDIPCLFNVEALQVLDRAEENWSEWLLMASYHVQEVATALESYLHAYFQLPLHAMEAVGNYSMASGVNWHDFPILESSQGIEGEIDGVNQQLDYLQAKASMPVGLPAQKEYVKKLVVVLTAPLNKRLSLLKKVQQAPVNEALLWQAEALRAKQAFEWLFSNLHYQHFDAHNRIMQFIFNTWIEIQGQLKAHQQAQNQTVLLRLSEYAYHEALKEETPPAGRDAVQEQTAWPPYYLWAFVFALSQSDPFIRKACTHLLIKTWYPQQVDSLALMDFEQWCVQNQAGVSLLYDRLMNNEHFKNLKGALFTHGQQSFQFEMVKLAFHALKAMVSLKQAPFKACAARFASEVLPVLSELILMGYEPAIDFVTTRLKEASSGAVFLGSDYNLVMMLMTYHERRDDFPNAWSFLQRLETYVQAKVIKPDVIPKETRALLQILFDEKARETALDFLIGQAKNGDSETLRSKALDALQRAGHFTPVAALACVKYSIDTETTQDNKILKFMRLAAEADPAEASYLNYLFLRQRKMIALESLIKAASFGHGLASSELQDCMNRYVEEKNAQLVKDFFIPALLQGKIQKYLSPDTVVNTLIFMIDTQMEENQAAYADKIVSMFIDVLKSENPPSRNTLIAMLLAKAPGRFSVGICDKLSQAVDDSHLQKNEMTNPATQAGVRPSFARQKGFFARNESTKEDDAAENTSAAYPGTNSL